MRSLVLGHRGLVGQALMRKVPSECAPATNLLEPSQVMGLLAASRPEHVYLAAATVGGIGRNSQSPGAMIRENLRIAVNVIDSIIAYPPYAKLLFLGSSCIYPRDATCPIREDQLMTGPLEPTNSAYAMAKLAGLEMCKAYAKQHGLRYVALMPCNLYGPGRPNDTHVVNMLMRRFHEAKLSNAPSVTVWGTGRPMRELMHVDDLAEAAVYFMNLPEAEGQLINVGTGYEISIHALAVMLAEIVGYHGDIAFDASKPDGVYRKVLDVSKANAMGWKAMQPLAWSLDCTYQWYRDNGGWS